MDEPKAELSRPPIYCSLQGLIALKLAYGAVHCRDLDHVVGSRTDPLDTL